MIKRETHSIGDKVKIKKQQVVEEIIPEISYISDQNIRDCTSMTWIRAIELGGWKSLVGIPFSPLIPNDSTSLINHTRTVTQMCLSVADIIEKAHGSIIDRDYLLSGAILHDIGKLIEYKKKSGKVVKSDKGKFLRHPFIGAWLALECGLPYEVAHIIAVHSQEGDLMERSPEAIIVHHCDFIHFNLLKSFSRSKNC
ncbi:MAG: HD domain-containing protein [Candidatus Bathyarchaeia archaeon]